MGAKPSMPVINNSRNDDNSNQSAAAAAAALSTTSSSSTTTNAPNDSASTTATIDEDDFVELSGGTFRGVAIAARKLMIAKSPAIRKTIRAVGDNRPLAFASEGAVAGQSIIPKVLYYGAWGLSGTAICADIYNKQSDAPEHLKVNTALYWTAFHVPASLVIPAVIIHQIVHAVDKVVENPKSMAKSWPPRAKMLAPVAAALISIIPVVPVVDYAAESIMEPTLGSYLGLSFQHHLHHLSSSGDDGKDKQE